MDDNTQGNQTIKTQTLFRLKEGLPELLKMKLLYEGLISRKGTNNGQWLYLLTDKGQRMAGQYPEYFERMPPLMELELIPKDTK